LAFATATTLSIPYKKWYVTVPAYVWASSVGYSGRYLGRHFPSDVLAGAAEGIGSIKNFSNNVIRIKIP